MIFSDIMDEFKMFSKDFWKGLKNLVSYVQ